MSQLQSTVDRMLNEAKERLKTHSAERKQVLDDKVGVFNSPCSPEKMAEGLLCIVHDFLLGNVRVQD